ncbi:MAG: hypothetical protein ACREDL_10055 [Bradyrhizobium sp.]
MALDRQIAANRANARQSTGPRTVAGRRNSSRNALKHGLSRRVDAAEVTALAAGLARCFNGESAAVGDVARHIAQARLELSRIRNVRDRLLIAALSGRDRRDVKPLRALSRYERPAVARWSRARKLLAAHPEGEGCGAD